MKAQPGEPLKGSTSMETAIGIFLGVVLALVVLAGVLGFLYLAAVGKGMSR